MIPPLESTKGYKLILDWLASKGRKPFAFQEETWTHIYNGKSGLVNAPTGCGKTFSVFLGAIIDFINHHPNDFKSKKNNGLQLLWITPLRALAKDIGRAMEEVMEELGMKGRVGIRNGDTPVAEREKQKRQMPEVLLITPESLHLLLAQKNYPSLFSSLKIIAVDEWHELLGSKRGVQVELAISRIVGSHPSLTLPNGEGINAHPPNKEEKIHKLIPPRFYTTDAKNWAQSIDHTKEMRSSPTTAEEILWQQLRAKKTGYKFRRQHPMINFIPDFVCIEKKIIVEVDGPYHKEEEQQLLDREREIKLEIQGYRIFRFTNEEIISSIDTVIEKIKSHLLSSLPYGESRRGVMVWGISATIGNLEEAKEVLLSAIRPHPLTPSPNGEGELVRAKMKKEIIVESIFPDEIEKYPWAGHLGIKLIDKIIPIIQESKTTLLFINTRGMSETWYQKLLDAAPDLAGAVALHHGSVDMELRTWVEENLHSGKLKVVVCTSSLDLGVDFRPVETVIQVGSPKGVARFLQRAGRSGHSFDEVSKIYFLPTHSLELMEAAALKKAIAENIIESRVPMLLCYDVLIQYLSTLAISDGFDPDTIFKEVTSTYCYREMIKEEWDRIIHFITTGGTALQQYDDYKKMEVEDGLYKIKSRKIAMRHRLHIGTIVSESMMKVKFISGGYIGVIEEYFISRLEPGEVFSLAGKNLEFVMIKDMTVLARKSSSKKSKVPSWQGGRMPLSANLGKLLRGTLNEVKSETSSLKRKTSKAKRNNSHVSSLPSHELQILQPLFELQQQISHVPKENELLIEQIETKDGFHLFVYPFEGRLVHEAMAAILAYRISRITAITFSFAMNDYGFELLSDQPIPVDDSNVYELFSPENLLEDIQRSVNSTEMAKRKFRDIAVIGGLIFQGYPGEQKKARHLQASASLLFNVFSEYEPGNLLLRQSYTEVLDQQMEELRLRDMLHRIQHSKIVITFPQQLTPFCFPVKVDSMREDLSSEKLEDRVRKMMPMN